MKIKNGYMTRDVAGSHIVVAVGAAAKEFPGMIRLNDTGLFLWKALAEEITREELISKLMGEYEIDGETAAKDTDAFLEVLKQAKAI